jgi:serine/threonine-protein kinase
VPLEVGAKLGRYRIDALLGRGGMGEVYRAYDARLEREVALKVLRRFETEREQEYRDRVERFLREARLAAKLKHPNIVTIFDVDEVDGLPLFSMELLEGRTLRSEIDSPAPLSLRLDWLRQLAEALEASHRAGLIHRDVKPENILVSGPALKLVDFGIAKPASGEAANLTQPGYAVGTPRYMAPEHLLGLELDARADQFAWGVVAYELLRGEHPGTTPLPLDEAGAAPPEVARVVARAMARDPAQRFSTMDDLIEALRVATGADAPTREQRALAANDEPTLEAPTQAASAEHRERDPSTRIESSPAPTDTAGEARHGSAATTFGAVALAVAALSWALAPKASSQTEPADAGRTARLASVIQCRVAEQVDVAGISAFAGLRVVGTEREAWLMARELPAPLKSGFRLLAAKIVPDRRSPSLEFARETSSPLPPDMHQAYAVALAVDAPTVAITATAPRPVRRPRLTSLSLLSVYSLSTRPWLMRPTPLHQAEVDVAWTPSSAEDSGAALDPRNLRVVVAGEAVKDWKPNEPMFEPDAGPPREETARLPSRGAYVEINGCGGGPNVIYTSGRANTAATSPRIAAGRTRSGVLFVDQDTLFLSILDARCLETRHTELDSEGISDPAITPWGDDLVATWTKRRDDGAYVRKYSVVSPEGLVSIPAPLIRDDLDTPLLRLRSSRALLAAAWLEGPRIRLAISTSGPSGFRPVPLLEDAYTQVHELDLAVAGRTMWLAWKRNYDFARVARIDCTD